MWTKEAPKEPGFYWIRAEKVPPGEPTMTVAHVFYEPTLEGYPGANNLLWAGYPGSEDAVPVRGIEGLEWWPEPISPPGGQIRSFKRHEAEEAVAFDLKNHLPGRTSPERLYTRYAEPLSLIESGDLISGLFDLAGSYRLRIEAFRQAREKRKLAGMRIESTAPSTGYGKAEAQRAAGLRTVAKPGEPGYSENLRERAEHD
jgi:hypothetical protein